MLFFQLVLANKWVNIKTGTSFSELSVVLMTFLSPSISKDSLVIFFTFYFHISELNIIYLFVLWIRSVYRLTIVCKSFFYKFAIWYVAKRAFLKIISVPILSTNSFACASPSRGAQVRSEYLKERVSSPSEHSRFCWWCRVSSFYIWRNFGETKRLVARIPPLTRSIYPFGKEILRVLLFTYLYKVVLAIKSSSFLDRWIIPYHIFFLKKKGSPHICTLSLSGGPYLNVRN